MPKRIIIANWKMNPVSKREAVKLFDMVKKGVKGLKNSEIIVCPPFVYLSELKGLPLGAQNIFNREKGAFTGEISPLMLKDLGVEYVIVGHSERRVIFLETDEMVNKKIKMAIDCGLKVIFCVGEKDGEERYQVLEKQIRDGLKGIKRESVKNIIIAYEPVWAIGTGKNCSIDETLQSVLLIKKIITNLYNRVVAEKINILYGGSVNLDNSGDYIKEGGVNGLLVGGASLNAEEFIKIVKSVS